MVYKILISGDQYKTADTFSISQRAGSVSSSSIDVQVENGQSIPVALMSVQILDENDKPFFYGFIQSVESPTFSTGYQVKRYRLSVQSAEWILSNRLVSESYPKKKTHEIVNDLYTKYIQEEGFGLGTISITDKEYENYNCSFSKLSEILTELATEIDALYYIDGEKKFHFITKGDFKAIEAPNHITGVKYTEEAGELRSVQVVTGTQEETSDQTEVTTWQADQTTMILGYQVKAISPAPKGVAINAVPASVGIRGIDEQDPTKTFLYEEGSNVLTVNYNATVKPVAGNIVLAVYSGYYDIIVTNTNDQLVEQLKALSGTSGKIETRYDDQTITNYDDANNKANALLQAYNAKESEISLSTHELEKTELYSVWNIDFPALNISGEYVITERTISNFGEKALIKIKAKSKNYYMKYGTVLKKETKQKGVDVKVYKQTSISDKLLLTDGIAFNKQSIALYPSDSAFFDQLYQEDNFVIGGF